MAPQIRTIEDYQGLSESERTARSRALQALAIARREGRELEWAAGQAGSSMKDVREWVGDALRPTHRGRTFAKPWDSIARVRPLFFAAESDEEPGGLDFVVLHSSGEADEAQRIFDDQYRFIEGTANRSEVERHYGKRVADREVEADPDALIAIAQVGRRRHRRALPRAVLVSARCIGCGARASRRHHPTGCDFAEEYLDADFTVSVCHDDHELIHDDRRTVGTQMPRAPLSWFERVELRLRRIAGDLARLSEVHPDNAWLTNCARWLLRWADELANGLRAMDARDPGWRKDPAFYPPGTWEVV